MKRTAPVLLAAAAAAALAPTARYAAKFVDHQAIRARFSRAQFELTQNNGEQIISNMALEAERQGEDWRVTGAVFVSDAAREGLFHLDCTVGPAGVALKIGNIDTLERLDR